MFWTMRKDFCYHQTWSKNKFGENSEIGLYLEKLTSDTRKPVGLRSNPKGSGAWGRSQARPRILWDWISSQLVLWKLPLYSHTKTESIGGMRGWGERSPLTQKKNTNKNLLRFDEIFFRYILKHSKKYIFLS